MNILLKATLGSLMLLAFVFIVNFTIINFMLGCETWDKELWTQYNSCIMPREFVEMLIPF